MATSENLHVISVAVDADYSAGQFTIMTLQTDGQALQATTNSSPLIGILQNKPAAAGRAGEIAIGGVSKCVASAAISVLAQLTATTGGKAVTTTTDHHFTIGIALTAATADGDIIDVLIMPGMVSL